jgi:uncharacterized protein YggE
MFNVKNSRWYFVAGGLLTLAVVVGIAISALPAATAGPSRANDGSPVRSITVVGSGSASAAPDLATAQIGVDTQAASPEEATRKNQASIASVIAALKAAGTVEKDIQTAYYNLYTEQRYPPNSGEATGEPVYHVTANLSVKVRDLAKVGKLLEDMVKAGANNISGVSFSIADTKALEASAREKAIADAKARAQALAELSGVELSDVLTVSEVISAAPGPILYESAMVGMGGGGGVSIQPGQLEVSIQVQVSYAIR